LLNNVCWCHLIFFKACFCSFRWCFACLVFMCWLDIFCLLLRHNKLHVGRMLRLVISKSQTFSRFETGCCSMTDHQNLEIKIDSKSPPSSLITYIKNSKLCLADKKVYTKKISKIQKIGESFHIKSTTV
jgi:hypothetical protein